MQETTLLNKIKMYQKNYDKNILEELILKFTPLLKKYASKISFEDSMQDLIVAFIEILRRIPLDKTREDKYTLAYISRSIKNEYIKLLSKSFKNNIFYYDEDLIQNRIKSYDITEKIELLELFKVLSDREKYILYLIYFKDISIVNIAIELNTSRQYINQVKLKALKKLRRYI